MKRLFVVVLLALFVSSAAAAEKRFTVPIGQSPVLGPENAPVTIIEFIDFQ